MDSPHRKFLGEYLERLKKKAEPHARLFKHTLVTWLQSVRTAATTFGIQVASTYQFRHAGASDDYLTGRRSISDSKRRGHWASDTSVRRYEQGARALSGLMLLSPVLREFVLRVHANIAQIMLKKVTAPYYRGPIV